LHNNDLMTPEGENGQFVFLPAATSSGADNETGTFVSKGKGGHNVT